MRAVGCVPRHKAWLLRGHCARDPGPPALGAEGWSSPVASFGHCGLSHHPRPALRAWRAGFSTLITYRLIYNEL